MEPMHCLYERLDLPRVALSTPLHVTYGGDLGFARPVLYANFVASADGVVALPIRGESGAVISANNEADRFVMGLLRAFADAVLVGAGTFRAGAGELWLPEAICPASAADFAELRSSLGLRPRPLLIIVSDSGLIDVEQPALEDCLILTSPAGASRLQGRLPPGARAMIADLRSPRAWMTLLRGQGLQAILCEGGPTLLGALVVNELLDELFLTGSPMLFGRQSDDGRKSLVSGVDLPGTPMELLSVRRHQSHLMLRYRLQSRSSQ